MYFTISSVEESTIGPIEFSSCVFRNNTAFAQLCVNSGLKEGQGGAISIVGVSFPALVLRNCNFTYNVAMTYVGSSLPSIGGAMAITQSSNLTMEDGYLGYNLAMYGIGNDLASVTSDLEDQNYVNIRNITFAALPDTGATTKLISATQSSFRQYCSVVSDIVSDSQSENALSGKFYTLSEECTKLVETHGREIALTKNCRQRKQASTHILSKRELKQANDMNGFDFVAEKELGHTISGLQLLSLSETELLYHHIQSMQFETGRFSEFTTIFEGKRSEQYQEDSRHISIGAWVKDALISRYNEFSLKEVYHSQKRLHAAKRKAKNDSYSSHSNFLTEVFTGQSSSFLFSNFTDALQNFLAYRISVVATSGQTFISNPTFIGKTHLYFGDYLKINADPSSSSNSLSIHPSVSLIEGTLIQEDLTISIVSAVLTLSNPQKRFVLGQLNVFNSTLYIIDNITVSGTSFAANSKIMGIRKVVGEESFTGVDSSFGKSVDNPSITFMQNFITGYSIQSLQNIRDHRKIDLIGINNNETVMSNMELNSVSLIVENGLLLATSFSRSTFSLDKLINFSLLNRAVINIISGASLNIVANTLIKAESSTSPALKNSGQINLLGDSNSVLSLLGISSNRVSPPSTADLGSLTSILDVDGTFQQLSSGSVNIKLNSTGQSIPVLNLISNQSLSGALNLNFDKVTNPDVELYDTDNPSKWSLVSFQVLKESVGETSPLIINAPEGLEFSMKLNSSVNTKRFLDHNVSFTLSVVIENIGCAYVNTYYSGVSLNDPSGYNCYVCLQNSSCNLCSDGYCEVEGMCANDAVSFSSNCCGSNCNSPYGKCVASDDYKSFSCKCESALFTGSDCKELQTYIIILIVIGGSLLLMLLFAIFSYKRSQKQKTMVLEELRDGLLRNTMGANNEYIQYMQQALILNDVFVKFEEIKLESKIGEGSFGVVHKATFRGAQVAVKMMRSLFIELTEKDIDEFRKEAYMMSRY